MSEQKISPHEKLHHFLDLMYIKPEEQQIFEEITPFFLSKTESFAAYLYNYFLTIKASRGFLENESPPGHMSHVWAQWFNNFFILKITDGMLSIGPDADEGTKATVTLPGH